MVLLKKENMDSDKPVPVVIIPPVRFIENLSILRHKVATRLSIVVPVKHGMAALMQALKEAEIKAEAIPVHMHHGNT